MFYFPQKKHKKVPISSLSALKLRLKLDSPSANVNVGGWFLSKPSEGSLLAGTKEGIVQTTINCPNSRQPSKARGQRAKLGVKVWCEEKLKPSKSDTQRRAMQWELEVLEELRKRN